MTQRLLGRMTRSLAFRGPDRQRNWSDGPAGLGHTLLRTGEPEHEPQPASLDGRVWITADVRIDARAELVEALERGGRTGVRTATDAELILHAYRVWGDDCVDPSAGRFRVCHLGRARAAAVLRPRSLRHQAVLLRRSPGRHRLQQHARLRSPASPRRQRAERAGHRRLPDVRPQSGTHDDRLRGREAAAGGTPADVREDAARIERYWTLPTEGRIRYRRSQRLRRTLPRGPPSRGLRPARGGHDRRLDERRPRLDVYRRARPAAPDRTRRAPRPSCPYRRLRHADSGSRSDSTPGLRPRRWVFRSTSSRRMDTPPSPGGTGRTSGVPSRRRAVHPGMHRSAETRRVGYPGHALRGRRGRDSPEFMRSSICVGRMPPWELAADCCAIACRSSPAPRRGPPSVAVEAASCRTAQVPPFPAWLNPAFSDRLDLRDRWARWTPGRIGRGRHTLRAEAHARLTARPGRGILKSLDPGVTGVAVEPRYPFLDLRVIDYLLAIPPVPWCVDKEILRLAMRGALPEATRLRRKSPLAGDPLRASLKLAGAERLDRFDAAPELARFVDLAAIPPLAGGGADTDPGLHIRPLCLNYWLTRVRHGTRRRGGQRMTAPKTGCTPDPPAKKPYRATPPGGLRRYPRGDELVRQQGQERQRQAPPEQDPLVSAAPSALTQRRGHPLFRSAPARPRQAPPFPPRIDPLAWYFESLVQVWPWRGDIRFSHCDRSPAGESSGAWVHREGMSGRRFSE